jgi:hypothetical protein
LVKKNYLTQLYAVHPSYALGVIELMPEQTGYTFEEIEEGAKTAHLVGLNPQFTLTDKGYSFMGMSVNARECRTLRFVSLT